MRGFHGNDYEELSLLRYRNSVRTSQETHYFSATESSRLILYKNWDIHGRDYEECRLLGYRNPVRTSQETHYVSATEPSRLMLCKFWSFQGGDYEKCCLLRCYAVLHTLHRLLVTANVVPISQILVSLMMEAIISFEMSVLATATRRNIPEDGILNNRVTRRIINHTWNCQIIPMKFNWILCLLERSVNLCASDRISVTEKECEGVFRVALSLTPVLMYYRAWAPFMEK
jgi:hypothetical protein